MPEPQKISQFDVAEIFSVNDFFSGIQKIAESEYKNVKFPLSVMLDVFAAADHHHNDLYLGLQTWNQMFELVPNDGNPYIKAKLDFLGERGITAYATGSLGDIWASMPVATPDTLGGIKVGDSLTINNGVLNINGDTFNLTNYYTKTQSDARYSQLGHTHTFASLTSKPTTLLGYGITDAYTKTSIDTALGLKFDKAGGSITGDVSIGGNLTVLGTEFIADVQTVQIADNLAVINYGETGNGVTAGFSGWEIDRGTATHYRFGFTESVGYFQVGKIGSLQTVATREDVPLANGFARWNGTAKRFDTTNAFHVDESGNLIVYGNILATGGITAYSTGSLGDIWSSMPAATTTTIGGIIVGSGLSINGAVLSVNGDSFASTNYYTKTSIDAFFAGTTSKTGYNKSNWDSAYTDRLKWDGGSTGLNATTGRTSLGLGTAATHDAQTSSTDTTTGRLMEVGAFGLGTATSLVKTYSEWDDLSLPTAFYRSTSAIDSIFGIAGVGINLSYASTYSAQLHIGIIGSNLKIQARATTASNVWGEPKELYHTGNLVNPVTGTGTAGYLPKFTGTSELGNSVIYETGGNVLIGTTTDRSARQVVAGNYASPSSISLGSGKDYVALYTWKSGTFGLGIHVNESGRTYIQNQRYDAGTAVYDICLQPLGGNVLIGKTSVTSGYMLDVNGAIRAAGNIYATGNITAAGEVTAYTASDARLKTNITSLANSINALSLIERLNPVTYMWNERALELNSNKSLTKTQYGLIAQELEEVVPDLIRPIYGEYKTYDDRGLMTLMLQAIKELKAEVDELRTNKAA